MFIKTRGLILPAVAFLALVAFPARAEQFPVENGLYAMGEKGSGTLVKTLDGSAVYLESKLPDAVEKEKLESRSNDNKTYYLSLEKTGPFSRESPAIALYVDGYCIRFHSSGSNQNTTFDISEQFESPEAAAAFAKFFNIKTRLRSHPGYKLDVRFIPEQKSFELDEPVPVRLEIGNVGSVPVKFQVGGENRGDRDSQFGFTAYYGEKPIPDTGNSVNFGGLSVDKTLKPGETFTQEADLRKWFTFENTGTYMLTGTYHMSFKDPDSNDWFPVWEDYAGARFFVVMGEPVVPPEIRSLIKNATTRLEEGRAYPEPPDLGKDIKTHIAEELLQNPFAKEAYQKLDAKNKNTLWFEGIDDLKQAAAAWSLASALCHPSDDVQIKAAQALGTLKRKEVVPFMLRVADKYATGESGSENATLHGVFQHALAESLNAITGTSVVLKDGQDPEGLRNGIAVWKQHEQ